MTEPEDLLHSAPLAPPSQALDHRIDALFSASRQTPRSADRTVSREWLSYMLASGIAASIIFFALQPIRRPMGPKLRAVEQEIAPEGLMRPLLLQPSSRDQTPPRFSVSVTTY